MLSQWLWIMLCYAEPVGVIHGACFYEQLVVNHGVLYRPERLWIIVWYAEPSGCESCVILSRVVVIDAVLYWASGYESLCGGCESCCVILSQWLWSMVYYAEPVVENHIGLWLASDCESRRGMLGQWLWIVVCYAEPVVVNHVLCWAHGCESCCAMLSQWMWFMVRYAEQLVVNHGVLYRPEWLWIIVWYTEPNGCQSCVILSRVVVNHVVLYWDSRCESLCGGCESYCVILSQ